MHSDTGYKLLKAASEGDDAMMTVLLRNKVDPNFQDEHGHTALMMAVIGKPLEQRDFGMWDSTIYTPGHERCIDMLLGVSDLTKRTTQGTTAFKFACRKGRAKAIKKMAEHGSIDEVGDLDEGIEIAKKATRHDEGSENEIVLALLEAMKEQAEIKAVLPEPAYVPHKRRTLRM